jgi:hypothetical protein
MHHRVNFVRGKNFLNLLAIRQIGLDENGGGGHCRPMAFHQVVEGNYTMAVFEQYLRTDTSNVSGATSHKNIQRKSSASQGKLASFEYTGKMLN